MDTQFPFYESRELGVGPVIVVGIFVAILLVIVWALFGFRRLLDVWKHREVLGLLKRSEDIQRDLEFEVTRSRSGTIDLPLLQRLGAKFSLSEQQRGRALTLPGLTARYLTYIDDVQRVLGKKYKSPKLIICIDELDKITDPQQVGNVLREIKGALYKENCFYLLSISEDAVRAFEGRLIEQRDIFESTFDEILFLDRLDLKTCLGIARNRSARGGYGPQAKTVPAVEEATEIAAVLSTGVPRELLRNLRVVENRAGRILDFKPGPAWHALFERKLRDILKSVRTTGGHEALRADLLSELDGYLEFCDDRYDQTAVNDAIARCRSRREALVADMAKLESESDAATQDFRVAALESEIKSIASWIRCWVELEIHLLVRYCSLSFGETDIQARDRSYASLLAAYAGLPYSTVLTTRHLKGFAFPGLPVAAE